MKLQIVNPRNNRTTEYTSADLAREARANVKGHGKLVRWCVRVYDHTLQAGPTLVAHYVTPQGVAGSVTVAL